MKINFFEHYKINWIPNIENKNKALYLLIAEKLEEDIKKGILTPGTKLPPQRDLANYLNINLSTVSRAFKICTQKGLICSTVGNGTFVATDVNSSYSLLPNFNQTKVIELGSMFPEYNENKDIIIQIQQMLEEPNSDVLLEYGSLEGTFFQREAVCKLINKIGYTADEKNILFSNGGQNAIASTFLALFKAGDKIGTNELVYPGVKTIAKLLGIQLIPIKSVNNRITEEGLLYACKNENIKGLYLVPDYHNPTTYTMPLDEREMIANIAKKENLIIIEDGILSLMQEKTNIPLVSLAPENTIYILSLSKIVAPALRLGFIVAPNIYKDRIANAIYGLHISLSPMLIDLASRLINSGLIYEVIKSKQKSIKERNKIVDGIFDKDHVWGDYNCIFRYLLLPNNINIKTFEEIAYKSGVKVYSSERFTVGATKVPNGIRISIATPRTNEKLVEALEILKKLIEN